ncbi:MAG: formate dehydrogenase subunit gamma [Thalassobaculum sp.]|uniref:formate dehydrogenase subunit gamma n=1 Tax=Thalassobaculum sp. TaxID=2022740 RepID=UPI0032F09CB8
MLRTIATTVTAALVVLLVYTVYLAAVSDDLVVPSNGVIGKAAVDDPAEGNADLQALRARTGLQRWRAESGPSPEQSSPAGAPSATRGAGTPADSADVARLDGGARVRDWLNREAGQSGLLQAPERVEGHTTLPGPVKDVFVQPAGRDWRSARNGPIVFGGALYMVGVLTLLAVFLAIRGRVPIKEGFSGRSVRRFDAFERANHWMTAVGFVLLALTGLILLYGKSLIRPWLGPDAFGDLAEGSAWLHMALILPFALGLIGMIVAWLWQNLPARVDLEWLKQGGGMLRADGPNPPADRFNAGQKLIFWAVILGGITLIASGVAMMFPFLWAGYAGMQLAQSIHAIVALAMIGVIFGHIYIGTVGMVGAFDAMWSGRVDRNWAKEHHSLWYRRLVGSEQPPSRPAE